MGVYYEKKLSFILIFVLSLTMLASCGKNANTSDGGETWTEAGLPLPETNSVWSPEGLSLDGETVWLFMRASGETGSSYVETFLSPDGGETWSREPMS